MRTPRALASTVPGPASRARLLRPAARLAAVLLAAAVAAPVAADDTSFFTDNVPPNVVLLIDTSYSMREIMYHPAFDSADSTCAIFNRIPPNAGNPPESGGGDKYDDYSKPIHYNCDPNTNHCRLEIDENSHGDFVETGTVSCPDGTTRKNGYYRRTFCGNTRNLYVDGRTRCDGGAQTWYSEWYLEWLFSDAADPYFIGSEANTSTDKNMIDANDNGVDYLTGASFPLYKRSRINAARQIAKEVIYQTNSNCGLGAAASCTNFSDRVRFGTAEFSGSTGGFVNAAVDDYSANRTAIDDALDAMRPNDSTPLAEALFKVYTYFMSRSSSELPKGQDGTTTFPRYEYRESDGAHDTSNYPPDPIECPDGSSTCPCQKHFVIIVTDGDPFNDDFTDTNSLAQGFGDFDALIGDYNNDGETETGYLSNGTLYLDDVAMFMNTNDFRPLDSDQPGNQTIDVYTVGFNLDDTTLGHALLTKTANVANGESFFGTQADEIRNALVDSISSIIEKTQSFTAATVPASRTTDGNNFYSTYFVPSSSSPFWEGHLKNFKFSLSGDILTADDKCAIGDTPTDPPCPTSGQLRTTANAVWDAADGVPAPIDRKLLTGAGATSFGASPKPWFTNSAGIVSTTLNRFDLGLDTAPGASLTESPYGLPDPASTAQLDSLAFSLVSNAAGCTFGTYLGVNCASRTNADGVVSLLGDIFHSNPVVVGSPNAHINDPTYVAFSSDLRDRDRMIYAGSNDGWVHGLLAGVWQTTDPGPPSVPLIPPRHDRGTGEEIFGFMPSETREKIWALPIAMNGGGSRDFYGPDGTAVAADVWMYRTIVSGALGSLLSPPVSITKQEEQWRTVLVGGLRQGGRSYYALDVTDPSASSYPGYLWEFPCDDCSNAVNPGSAAAISGLGSRSPGDFMGETWSDPVITRVRVKVDGQSGAQDRWVAVVGGGYDVCGDPNTTRYWDQAAGDPCDSSTSASKRGRAILMIDITTGELLAAKVFSPSDVSISGGQVGYSEMKYAIASQPAVFDLNFDGYADVIYIGDLGGQVWKWVVRDVGDDPINNVSGDRSLGQPDWPFELFFEGRDSSYPSAPSAGTHFQSFFYPPTATFSGGNLVLVFGAGERANPDAGSIDGDDSNNNHLYVVKDSDPYLVSTPVTVTEDELVDIHDVDGGTKTCSDVANAKGYFLTARDREKFVTNSVIFLGKVITGSFVPSDPSATTCDSSGSSYLYQFDLACGNGEYTSNPGTEDDKRRKAIGGGLPTRPRVSVGDLNSGGGGGGCNNKVVVITSDGGIENECPGPIPTSGINIRSWRER